MTRAKLLGLWFGIGGGLVVAAAVASSSVLIAPGVSVAGADVGLHTQGVAQNSIATRLTEMRIRIGGTDFTAAELGASVDAHALARTAIGAHPLWNVRAWNPRPVAAQVTLDRTVAGAALRAALPTQFADPTDARVAFDEKTNAFEVTAGRPGRAIDLNAVAVGLSDAVTGGLASVTITPTQTEAAPAASTDSATRFAAALNAQADSAGFYLENERLEPVPLATLASWVKIAADPATGEFAVTPDSAAVAAAVADLPARLDRKPSDETVVVNSSGTKLHTVTAGRTGAEIDGASAAAAVTTALAKGELTFALHGTVAPFRTTTLFRRIEVDKTAGTAYLYEGPKPGAEKVVASYPIAIGTGGEHETRDGRFTVYAQLTTQDMGDCNGQSHGFGYCTKHVPWISYFDGDQGFHGTYWHNNFGPGARMSHGCVNMRIADAEALYRFAQVGTEVWVHD